MCADLGNFDDDDISRAWENIGKNIKFSVTESLGCCGLKLQKPWFYKECAELLYQRKQATMQWFQNPSQNGNNLKNVNPETSRNFRNKKREYAREKTNEFMKDYQLRTE